jgi:hypothetical protein
MGEVEQDSQNDSARTGQPEKNNYSRIGQTDKTDRTGLTAQHCQDSTARKGHLEQESLNR